MNIERNRIVYFLLIVLTIAIGLFSRSSIVQDYIHPNVGDGLYALLFFFGLGFIFHKNPSTIILLMSVSCCFLIEILQLYQADWIQEIRNHKIGALILGHGFLWSDLVSYTLGGLVGYILELFYYKKRVS